MPSASRGRRSRITSTAWRTTASSGARAWRATVATSWWSSPPPARRCSRRCSRPSSPSTVACASASPRRSSTRCGRCSSGCGRTHPSSLGAVPVDLEDARASYQRDGCWVSPVLFDADEVERFREATRRVIDGDHRRGRAPTLSLPFEPTERDLRKLDNAWWADLDLAALATDPRLGAIAAGLLQAHEVRLWQDQLLFKPPGRPE